MKDHLVSGHSTKFNAFKENEDQIDSGPWNMVQTNTEVSNFEPQQQQQHLFIPEVQRQNMKKNT